MKKKIFFVIVGVVTLVIIFALSNRVVELYRKNSQLKGELVVLKAKINEYNFSPLVMPRFSKIKLGEEYKAAIVMRADNPKTPPIVKFLNYKDKKYLPELDSLILYNEEIRANEFVVRPKKKGIYHYYARVRYPKMDGDTLSFITTWTLAVE